MQVLLTTLNAKYIHMNLAIRLLYGLNKHHQGLSWKEFAIKEEAAEIASACSRFDVIAFSCYIWNITQTLEVARIIKSLNPQAKILLGGPEVSYDWNDIIKLNEVDYIIVGEGEIPFAAFLNENL
jgi:anaerobic magnesium-protoporphyrin IX monomethyl ester cyclase